MMIENKNDKNISNQVLLKASLKPGNRVDIVLTRDEVQEALDVRSSLLHDTTADGKMILAQTSPPITADYVGSKIEVTFLIRAKKKRKDYFVRSGCYTKLIKIVPNYNLGRHRETVLVTLIPNKVRQANLRMHYRITPPSGVKMLILPKDMRKIIEQDLQRFVNKARDDLLEEEFNPDDLLSKWIEILSQIISKASAAKNALVAAVQDISFGGAKLAHPAKWDYPPGSQLELTLVWDDHTVDLNAKVVRTGEMEGVRSALTRFTCVKFVDNEQPTRSRLNKLIGEMNRQMLAKLSGLES